MEQGVGYPEKISAIIGTPPMFSIEDDMNIKELETGKALLRLSNYALDTFCAPKLSQLTQCNAPDLSGLSEPWLRGFILNTILRFSVPEPTKAHMFNFLRRTEAVFSEYNNARINLIEYVTSDRNTVSPYFRALLHFETLIAQLYQAALFLKALAKEPKFFEKGEGTVIERINIIYNASKHMG